MNFIAHAYVGALIFSAPSCDRPHDPAAVHDLGQIGLGAVLPDLGKVAGVRFTTPWPQANADVEAGIASHHRADGVFHAAPEFVGAVDGLTRRLTSEGLRRGPARASAHLAIEFLIDATLVDSTEALMADVWRAGWSHAPKLCGPDRLRWEQMLTHFSTQDHKYVYGTPEGIAARLERILSHRPRLSLDSGDQTKIVRTLQALGPFAEEATRLVSHVHTEIASSKRPNAHR